MSLDHLFKAQFTRGQTIKIVTPKGAMLDACEVNIGNITGKARSIPAILCDGVTSDDPWHIVNVIDSTKVLLDHIAVKGAVSLSQAERLCHKYLPVMVKGQVRNVVSMTDNAMKTFLDSTSLPSNTPFVLDSDAMLLDSMTTVQTVQWDENNKLLSHGGHISGVMYDMACCDTQGDLLTRVSPRDIAAILIDETCEFGGMLDAMITQYNKFDNVMLKVAEALKIYDNEDLFVKSVTPIEPFKRNGVVNIGTIFEMSDTQTITVLFNNPDITPSKLLSTDVLTSWKWMLNKRDVTATLQPRAVESKKYPVIAGRIIKLLAKNHDRFKRAQAVRQKEELFLNELVDQVEAEQSGLRYLDKEILRLQQIIDNETVRKQNQTEVGKADQVDLSAEGAEQFHNDLKESLEQNEQSVQMNNRQAIMQKATDLNELLISNHDFTTDTLAKQGEHTHNLLTKNDAHLAISTFIDETANGIWTLGLSSGGEINRLAEIDTRADINKIAQKLVEFDEKVTVLTGDEFGEFNLPEEQKELRKAVQVVMKEMVGKSYPCPALGRDVQIRNSGIKKILSNSADTRKLKAVAKLQELLASAQFVESNPSYAGADESNIKAYHSVKSNLLLEDESLQVLFVIREDDKGNYHYDHTIQKSIVQNAKSPLLDGLSATVFPMTDAITDVNQREQTRIANCQRTDSIENNQMTVNAMLDSANDDGEVLNMFIVETVPEANDAAITEKAKFLNDVIDGKADMSAPEFSEKLLELAEDLDPSLEELFEKASDAYADYAIAFEV
ncbi:MAG: hypothetical protein H9855_02575 [Candidatus Acinetobacter avistercoris]|nr:hypothetical protein [Candidatus Acinetobacter avistercoris]